MLKRYIYIFSLLLLFVAFSFSLISVYKNREQIWEGYYLIGIPEGKAKKNINNFLSKKYEIVSLYNTSIEYNDFDEIKEIPLENIDERFVKGDPRLDRYIKGAGDYFYTNEDDSKRYELVYLKSTAGELFFFLNLRRTFGKQISKWLIPDVRLWDNFFFVALFLLYWLYVVKTSKNKRSFSIFSGFPWVITIFLNGIMVFSFSIIFFSYIKMLFTESFEDIKYFFIYRKFQININKKLLFLFFIINFLVLLYFIILLNKNILIIIIPALTNIIYFLLYFRILHEGAGHQEHKIFLPVYLGIKKTKVIQYQKILEVFLIFTLITISSLFSFIYKNENTAKLPAPEIIAPATDWSWEELSKLRKGSTIGLVDAFDYLSHKAYQQAYMYGRSWAFPYKNETINIDYYERDGAEIKHELKTVLQFTEDWYFNIILKNDRIGLPRLLLSQKRPFAVLKKSSGLSCSEKFNPVQYIICFFALIPVVFQNSLKNKKIKPSKAEDAIN